MIPPVAHRTRTMARKHSGGAAPDPQDPFHVKLSRLVDSKRAGRTDGEIAVAAGMSASYFSRLITGDVSNPRFGTVQAILTALGASLSEFDRS